jgi:hypothetical protein
LATLISRISWRISAGILGRPARRHDLGATAELHPLEIGNVEGHSREGRRSLAIGFRRLAPGRVACRDADVLRQGRLHHARMAKKLKLQRGRAVIPNPRGLAGHLLLPF